VTHAVRPRTNARPHHRVVTIYDNGAAVTRKSRDGLTIAAVAERHRADRSALFQLIFGPSGLNVRWQRDLINVRQWNSTIYPDDLLV
jgi:hypothetical protein